MYHKCSGCSHTLTSNIMVAVWFANVTRDVSDQIPSLSEGSSHTLTSSRLSAGTG